MVKAPQLLLRAALLTATALPLVASCGGAPKTSAHKELSAREIMQRYKPAIVRIENDKGTHIGVGTGFIVAPDGRIATNLHVIIGGGKLRVKLSDHSMHEVTRVIAYDQDRDLAIIEIDTKVDMPTLRLGDSDAVEPGDSVIAVGNPMNFDYTVSDGLISSVRVRNDNAILQISAPISQGSSGGPLFNAFGEVIGVATMVLTEGQNLNFGVPINYLAPLLEKEGGETAAQFAAHFAPKAPTQPTQIQTDTGPITREIPQHSVSMLKECKKEQIVKVFDGINRAIELGAPLYNDGDHLACFNIYSQTATHFENDKTLCKPLRDSFGAGLLKAETKGDPTSKAWAMRDTFDGLLRVIVTLAQQPR